VSRRTLGPLALMLCLPPLTYHFWICLHDHGGALVAPSLGELAARIPPPTPRALALYGGSRLDYRLNGWVSFWASLAVAVACALGGVIPAGVVYDEFGPLLTTANLAAFGLALGLYARGWRAGTTTGDPIRDSFMGTTLNPRIGPFDLKYFCESRPGLILWVLFNLSLAAAQRERHGTVTTAMLLVNAFQFLYVVDYFWNEEAILTTWDIKHEKFGWMLAWGDLVWVPFTYTIQAYYLVDHPHALSPAATTGIVLLNVGGYAIFRATNIQKHRFRRDPARPVWGRAPEYIRTATGSLLLTSGWWGIARHLNYLGDLLMALAWCLPTKFEHPLPYFYFVYMIILLVHRERRDHDVCQEKYGADWDAYCRKVRWRIVPGVY